MRAFTAILAGTALAASLSGCAANVSAKTPAPLVALEMPAPPARVLVPVELTDAVEAPAPPPQAPAPTAPTTRPRDTPAPRPAAERPAGQPSASQEPASSQVLQTTANASASEQKTTTLLTAAQKDLDRLKREQLSANARAQFDQAVGFIRMAREAIRIKNYMYAEQLATKAAAVAALLAQP